MEKIVNKVYKIWKKDIQSENNNHPSDEIFAAFIEKKLSLFNKKKFMHHIVFCQECKSKLVSIVKVSPDHVKLSDKTLTQIKKVLSDKLEELVNISIRFRNEIFEVINSNFEYVLGHQQNANLVLRGKDKAVKDYMIFYKKISNITVKVKVEHQKEEIFNAQVELSSVKNKETLDKVRVSLFLSNKELESYVLSNNRVCFDALSINKYKIKIMKANKDFTCINLDINN